jgi:heme oxygenase (biliverdin-IX-beta and delta-forming)
MSEAKPYLLETGDTSRSLAQHLLRSARHGALGVLCPDTDTPLVSRVSVGTAPDGMPVTLISEISMHTGALRQNPACSLLIGEPGGRGDPLTHPRLTLQCSARPTEKAALKQLFLSQHPKATLYYDFSDFIMMRLEVLGAHLNGGFGKAYRLDPNDLDLAQAAVAYP